MKTIDIECKCPNCGHICKEELDIHVDDLVLDDEELLYHLLYRFNKNDIYEFLLRHDLLPN